MSDACEHRVQLPHYDANSDEPWQYKCKHCGETTCKSVEIRPFWGVTYHRSEPGSFWMGLERKEYGK